MTSTSNTCLDVFGPADVFYFANYLADRDGLAAVPYRVELAARRVGPVRTSAGPALRAQWSVTDPHLRPDLLLVAGGADGPGRHGRCGVRRCAGAPRCAQ